MDAGFLVFLFLVKMQAMEGCDENEFVDMEMKETFLVVEELDT